MVVKDRIKIENYYFGREDEMMLWIRHLMANTFIILIVIETTLLVKLESILNNIEFSLANISKIITCQAVRNMKRITLGGYNLIIANHLSNTNLSLFSAFFECSGLFRSGSNTLFELKIFQRIHQNFQKTE